MSPANVAKSPLILHRRVLEDLPQNSLLKRK